MAIYHFNAKIISRSAGQSVVAAAAYRRCALMVNELTGDVHDYRNKTGLVHGELAMPDNVPVWVSALLEQGGDHASAQFWYDVEANAKRVDAQFAREMTLALPTELTREQNIELVREFVKSELTGRGIVADWVYHDLPNNPHIHILSSLRPLTDEGFGNKKIAILGEDGTVRRGADGKIIYQEFALEKTRLVEMREAWASVQNHHLAMNGFGITVDHRSYAEQGLDIEPTVHRGPTADAIHKRGDRSYRVDEYEHIKSESVAAFMANPALVLKEITAQKSVFDERDVARVVLKHTSTREDYNALLMRVGELDSQVMIAGPVFDPLTDKLIERPKYTTREVLETERAMIESARHLRQDNTFYALARAFDKGINAVEHAKGFTLNPEQSAAVRAVTGDAGLSVIVGYAGAGKSTVMGAVRQIYEDSGHRVVGGALAGKAVVGLQDSAGISSRTLASWETSWKVGKRLLQPGDIFIMDEAGMVGSVQMGRFTKTIDEASAKLVLVGDARQLQPIEAGAAFRAIANDVGYTELTEVNRQHQEWMRTASVSFGTGQSREALEDYRDHGNIQLSDDIDTARARLIDGWSKDWSVGANVLMLAHRNVDVTALNTAAREIIKVSGGLQDEIGYKTNRGMRRFAVGDRVVFLEKSRELGVENGSLGSVAEIDNGRLVIITDANQSVAITQNTYASIDHGYATTIHKSQGATVDSVHVLASPTMDAHLSYVSMTRHRDEATLYASKDEFKDIEVLLTSLSRERLKTTTLAYEQQQDYQQSIVEFAERRGIPSFSEIGEMLRSQLQSLRERFMQVAGRLQVFGATLTNTLNRQPAIELAPSRSVSSPVPPVAAELRFPDTTAEVLQALSRLQTTQDHSRVVDMSSAGKEALGAAQTELRDGRHAADVVRFNEQIIQLIPRQEILKIGPVLVSGDADRLFDKYPDYEKQAFVERWPQIHAGQQAAFDLVKLDMASLLISDKEETLVHENYEKMQEMWRAPDEPLIAGVTRWPMSVAATVRRELGRDADLAGFEQSMVRSFAKVWDNPGDVVGQVVEQIGAGGDYLQIRTAIKNDPGSFGQLLGKANFLGRADDARKQALSQVVIATSSVSDYGGLHGRAVAYLTGSEAAFRRMMEQPVVNLTPAARDFLARAHRGMEEGHDYSQLVRNQADNRALAEVRGLLSKLHSRFGKSGANRILDYDRLARAVPSLDTQAMENLTTIIRGIEQTTNRMNIIRQAQTTRQNIEQSHSQDRGHSF